MFQAKQREKMQNNASNSFLQPQLERPPLGGLHIESVTDS